MITIRTQFVGISACIFLFLCSGCVFNKCSAGLTDNRFGDNLSDYIGKVTTCVPDTFENILISKTGSLEVQDCRARCLADKVIMLMSSSCEHCIETEPDFLAACEERGITPIIFDMDDPEQVSTMESFGISIYGTPTFIFGCDYYLGDLGSEEDYLAFIDRYLSRQ
jgi:hypothetical protein